MIVHKEWFRVGYSMANFRKKLLLKLFICGNYFWWTCKSSNVLRLFRPEICWKYIKKTICWFCFWKKVRTTTTNPTLCMTVNKKNFGAVDCNPKMQSNEMVSNLDGWSVVGERSNPVYAFFFCDFCESTYKDRWWNTNRDN